MKKKLIIISIVLIFATAVYAAQVKWSAMAANVAVADDDVMLLIDTGTGASQKITVLNLFDTIDTFAELNTITADKTLVNEEDAVTWDSIITFSTAITLSDAATIDQSANNYIDFAENGDTLLFYYDATDLAILWSDGALNLQNAEDGVNAIVNIIGKDAGEYGILRVKSDGDDKYIELYNDDTDAVITNSAGNIILNPVGLGIVIGDNGDEDYTITFDGDTSNGILNYDEDNADFEFDQDVITTGVFYAPAFDAPGAEDMDYGSADITDHSFTTDDSTFIIDGGITVSTGDVITLGVVQWNSADEIDGTKIKDADYGDIDVSAGGAWTLDTDSVADNEIDYTNVTGADLTLTDAGAITSTGTITATVGFDIVGAADIDYGSIDVLDHTFVTDGTGDAEVVLPNDSIGDAEIDWTGLTTSADFTVTGTLITSVGIDGVGAVDLDYGSIDITDHTFTTDGTGTAEIVLPAGSIDSAEILDATVTEVDLNVTNAPGAGEDNYVLTYNHAGTNMTWAVDAGAGVTAWDDIGDPDNSGLITITFDNAEATLFTGDNDAAVSFMTIQNSDGDHTVGSMYLLDLDYSADDGDAEADFIKFQDSGSVVMTIQQNGDITTDGGLVAGGAITEGGVAVPNVDEIDWVAAAEMADADHGDVAWSGGAASVESFTMYDAATSAYYVIMSDTDGAGANSTPYTDTEFTYTEASGTVAATEFSGGGGSLTGIDAATGDSATAFFDAGTIEHEWGGLQADVSGWTGLFGITGADTSVEVDTSAEMATAITDETGSGKLTFATAPVFTTSIQLTGADADPAAAAGTIAYDNTIAVLSGGAIRWYDNDSVRVIVDLETDPVDGDDDKIVAYDSAADGFYMKADDDTGGVTKLNDIGDADGAGTVVSGAHEHLWTWENDAANEVFMNFSSIDADTDNNQWILELSTYDDGDANLFFFRCRDDVDTTPNTVFEIAADGATSMDGGLTVGGSITEGGVAVPNVDEIDWVAAAEMADADHGDVAWSGGDASVEAATIADTVYASCYVGLFEAATGADQPFYTDGGLTYDATSGTLSATQFVGGGLGGATAWDDIADPDLAATIDFVTFTQTIDIGVTDTGGPKSGLILDVTGLGAGVTDVIALEITTAADEDDDFIPIAVYNDSGAGNDLLFKIDARGGINLAKGAQIYQALISDNYIYITENSDTITLYFGGTDVDFTWSDGALNLRNQENGVDAIVNIQGLGDGEKGILRVDSDGDDKHIELHHDDTDGHILTDTGDIHIEPAGGDVSLAANNLDTTGNVNFGGADLELPQAAPGVPDADGEVELDFTDGKMVIQHGAAHAELGGSVDVVMGTLIKSWSGTIFEPDGINDVMTVKAINSIEFPHGVVITAVYLGVSEDSNYTLTFQNFDDFDTINGGNPTIDAVAYTADTTGEVIDTTPTFATIAAGQIIMISIPATNVDWINFCIYYYEPAA